MGTVIINLNQVHPPKIYLLANILRNLLAKLVSDSPLATWRVDSAIPDKEQCNTLFVYFRSDTLYLNVVHSIWVSEHDHH